VEDRTDSAKVVTAELPKRQARNCDFSKYRPLRMSSDWLWRGGIAKRVEPIYPSEAKRRRLQGKISVRVLINGNGEVEQACGNGHPLLCNAAEEAALRWVFRTPKLNGEKIPYVQETLVFDFVLDGSSGSRAHP
jgi:TonB family protein